MKIFKLSYVALFAAAMMLGLSSCSEDALSPDVTENPAVDERRVVSQAGPTIVDLAIATPELSILVDAVVKAGLVDVLNDRRKEFTVFAPTNDAFVQLLADAGFASLDDVPADVLTTILLTHVVSGEFFAADLSTGYVKTNAKVFSARPTDIFINTADGVTINGNVNVVIPNVDADNGVVHVVDAVIAPSNIVTLAASNPNFSILVQALTRPDLSIDFLGALNGAGPLTVVAPTNQAFIDLLNAVPAWSSLDDIPAETLEAVLLYHVSADGNLTSRFLASEPTVNSLLGETWTTERETGSGRVIGLDIISNTNSANVVAADVQGQNGVIHAIDTVILP